MRASTTTLRAALLAAAVAFAPLPAIGGTIGFKTDAKVTSGPGVDVEVTLTHTGDEAASDVRVTAELLDKSVAGEEVTAILPGQNHVWKFHLADTIARGVYSIVLRANYADANGYAFEIVSTAAAPVGVTGLAKLSGSVDVPRLTTGSEAEAILSLRKPDERSGKFEVELVAPSGIGVTPAKTSIEFNDSGKATARFTIRNKDLLAGTSVNLFAFVTGNDGGYPQTDAIRGVARVTAPVTRVTADMFYKAAGAMLCLLVVLEILSRFVRRRRPSEDAA